MNLPAGSGQVPRHHHRYPGPHQGNLWRRDEETRCRLRGNFFRDGRAFLLVLLIWWTCVFSCFYYSGDVWPDCISYIGGLASLLVFLLFWESFLAKFVAVSECHGTHFVCPFLCYCGRVWVFRALLLVGMCPFLSYCWWACALSRVIVGGHVPCLALLLMRRTCPHAS